VPWGIISRRLRNRRWKTHAWYTTLFEAGWSAIERWERKLAGRRRRHWMLVIDTTYHGTVSECMENLLCFNRHKNPRQRTSSNHAFVMSLLLTDKGGRLPLPRKSYYTKAYCEKKGRRYRSLNDLAAAMIREVAVPDDVGVTVVYDSAFDAKQVHQAARQRMRTPRGRQRLLKELEGRAPGLPERATRQTPILPAFGARPGLRNTKNRNGIGYVPNAGPA